MRFFVLVLGLSMAFSSSALAASVFLNGVNIDGLTNQTFERATVRLDEKGNVHIDAPGYSATVVTPPTGGGTESGAKPGKLTRRYWLATEEPTPGMAEYDVDLYVNGKWVRRVKSGDDQVVTDISKHLVAGKNSIVLTARKSASGARKSVSEKHYFRVIIGEGSASADAVTIEKPLVRFTRTAAETNEVSEEFVIEAR